MDQSRSIVAGLWITFRTGRSRLFVYVSLLYIRILLGQILQLPDIGWGKFWQFNFRMSVGDLKPAAGRTGVQREQGSICTKRGWHGEGTEMRVRSSVTPFAIPLDPVTQSRCVVSGSPM